MGVKQRMSVAKSPKPATPNKGAANGGAGRKSLPAKSPKPQTPAKTQTPAKPTAASTQSTPSNKRKSIIESEAVAASPGRRKSMKKEVAKPEVEEEESDDDDYEMAAAGSDEESGSDEDLGSEEESEGLEDLEAEEGDSEDELSGEEEEGSGEEEDDSGEEEQKPAAKKGAKPETEKKKKKQKDPKESAGLSHPERTIFVGNLPKEIEKKELYKIFQKYGKISSLRLRSVPVADPRTPPKVAAIKKEFHKDRTNINAYIVFESEESASKAVEANGSTIKGRHIRVDMLKRPPPDHKKAIFVGNVPFTIDEEQVRKVFEGCGEIESVRVVRNKGIGKGFVYVNFKNVESVELALLKHGEKLEKRQIRVFRSKPTSRRRGTGKKTKQSPDGKKPETKTGASPAGDKAQKKKKPRFRNKNKGKVVEGGDSPKKAGLPSPSFQGEKVAEQGKVQKKKKQKKNKSMSPKKQEAIETLVKTMPGSAKKNKKK